MEKRDFQYNILISNVAFEKKNNFFHPIKSILATFQTGYFWLYSSSCYLAVPVCHIIRQPQFGPLFNSPGLARYSAVQVWPIIWLSQSGLLFGSPSLTCYLVVPVFMSVINSPCLWHTPALVSNIFLFMLFNSTKCSFAPENFSRMIIPTKFFLPWSCIIIIILVSYLFNLMSPVSKSPCQQYFIEFVLYFLIVKVLIVTSLKLSKL